mgnify:CR=1 FL=1
MPKIDVEFEDNRIKVKGKIREICISWLYETAGEIQDRVTDKSRVDTGHTKGSWKYIVDSEKQEAYVGSNYQNAIWEEYGTGQYALNGDGRKTPWRYQDEKGNWHTTRGKTPTRALFKAFQSFSSKAKRNLEKKLKGL